MNALGNKKFTPWKNGYYRIAAVPSMLFLVDGENIVMHSASGKPTNSNIPFYKGTWKYGDFGKAHPDIIKESGKSHYDVEMDLWGGKWTPKAVLSEDGTKLIHFGIANAVDVFTWQSEDELEAFLKTGDPHDAMSHQYKEQPDFQGKLIWLSGAPGLGKSTSGLLLVREKDYAMNVD